VRPALLEGLDEAVRGLRLRLETSQLEALVDLALLVADWGARMNLSGHREPGEILDRLVVDALALRVGIGDLVGDWPRRMVDLGSGAGFPGLPLAIAEPGTTVELVEARERRHHFQRAACRKLRVANAIPRLGRIEALPPTPADLVVAQAVGPLERVVAIAEPWVAVGGWLVVPTGDEPPHHVPASDDWGPPELRRYGAPGHGGRHCIWAARREAAAGSA